MKIIVITDPRVKEVFAGYPDFIRPKMDFLKELVLETAKETGSITELRETLKWNEPSFVTRIGSTLRIDWKEKTPEQYSMYFQCNSRLVETFRLVFKETFDFESKRAIIFQLDQEIPVEELKQCIKTALTYHQVKHLIHLGL